HTALFRHRGGVDVCAAESATALRTYGSSESKSGSVAAEREARHCRNAGKERLRLTTARANRSELSSVIRELQEDNMATLGAKPVRTYRGRIGGEPRQVISARVVD